MSERDARAGGVISSRSGWISHPRLPTARVRVDTQVEVEVTETSSMYHAARIQSGALATGILAWRGAVSVLGLAVWVLVRALECSAAIAVAAERMMGGGRYQVPLLYWRRQSTALARTHEMEDEHG